MIKVDGRCCSVEGSMIEILDDTQRVISMIYEFLQDHVGEQADEVLALIGQFAVTDDSEKCNEIGMKLAQTVVEGVGKKLEAKENNDGKETCEH